MTTSESLPDDICELILKRIDSVGHLEALLLLRSNASAGKEVAALARELYISKQEAINILDQLSTRGFVVCTGGIFQYRCTSSDLAGQVDRLALFYRTHLIPVTNLIHGKPAARIRQFADAFKLRKDR